MHAGNACAVSLSLENGVSWTLNVEAVSSADEECGGLCGGVTGIHAVGHASLASRFGRETAATASEPEKTRPRSICDRHCRDDDHRMVCSSPRSGVPSVGSVI